MRIETVVINGKEVPRGVFRLGKPTNFPVLCPVCGKFAFAEHDNYDVCPFCGWENDEIQSSMLDDDGSPNNVSLEDARKNYAKFGAKNKESIPLVKALQEQLQKGVLLHNATFNCHVQEFVEDADPVKMIKNS